MSYKLIYELQNLQGGNNKKAFLDYNRDNEYLQKFLYYALTPTLTYNVSSQTVKTLNLPCIANSEYSATSLFDMCEILSSKQGITNEVINVVHEWLWQYNEEERNLYIQLLAKELRLGVTATTVNKCIPGLIPVWEVQQALTLDNCPIKEGTEFWLTQKLNGTRATYYKGSLYSRNGTPYTGLDHIINEIETIKNYSDFVFDGELLLKDTMGIKDNEAFRIATGIVNSNDADKTSICFNIFDVVPKVEFDMDVFPTTRYCKRRAILSSLASNFNNLRVLPVLYHGCDQGQIDVLLDKMVSEDKEGLMMNLDVPYFKKRHNGILKIKKFYTMDLEVTGIEEGKGKNANTCGALIVDFLGNEVRVGSGLTDEFRAKFWSNPDNIIGKIIEVKYKEVSENKSNNAKSLQFPVFIRVRDDKSTTSLF